MSTTPLRQLFFLVLLDAVKRGARLLEIDPVKKTVRAFSAPGQPQTLLHAPPELVGPLVSEVLTVAKLGDAALPAVARVRLRVREEEVHVDVGAQPDADNQPRVRLLIHHGTPPPAPRTLAELEALSAPPSQ